MKKFIHFIQQRQMSGLYFYHIRLNDWNLFRVIFVICDDDENGNNIIINQTTSLNIYVTKNLSIDSLAQYLQLRGKRNQDLFSMCLWGKMF